MFFRKPPFGVDISDYSIEIISLEGSLENPRLLAMGRTVLEPGIFEDGKILNKEKLTESLKKLVANPKFGKIKHPLCASPKIIFAIPESKSYIHIFELPKNLKRSEVIEFVKSQAAQTFPHPLADLYFDFQIQLPTSTGGGEVLLIAAPQKIVNDYLEVFKDCNLIPVALEIESLSLARALLLETEKPILIADIGARTTNLSIFDQGQLRLSFSLPIAGNKFTQALSEKLNLPQKAAESLKKEIGLDPKYQEGRVFLILQKEIQGIIEEINKIEGYFSQKTGLQPTRHPPASRAPNIEKIILAGGSAALPHLPEYLAENLEKPVAIGDPWVKINIDILKKKEYFEKALEVNPVFYSTVIGSALRGLSKDPAKEGINLLPKRSLKMENSY